MVENYRSIYTTSPPPSALPGTKIGLAISRQHLDLVNPSPRNIHMSDMIFQLSRMPRYNGATVTRDIWTVGNHLCVGDAAYMALCAMGMVPYSPEIRAAFAFHDSPEMYISDLTTPCKAYLRLCGELSAYGSVEGRIAAAIATKYGLTYPLPPGVKALVKDVDNLAYEIERFHFRPVFTDEEPWSPHPITEMLLNNRSIIRCLNAANGLVDGWVELHGLYGDVACALENKALLVEVEACKCPYDDDIQFSLTPASARGHDTPSNTPAYDSGMQPECFG